MDDTNVSLKSSEIYIASLSTCPCDIIEVEQKSIGRVAISVLMPLPKVYFGDFTKPIVLDIVESHFQRIPIFVCRNSKDVTVMNHHEDAPFRGLFDAAIGTHEPIYKGWLCARQAPSH